tara:strand:- start:93 stop:320 length:228 start_codon:yes stop_codon:yes gene_type:complete
MEYHRTSDQSFYTNYSSEDEVDDEKDNIECIIELIELRIQLEDMKFNGEHFYRGNLIKDELENIENELHHYGWYL